MSTSPNREKTLEAAKDWNALAEFYQKEAQKSPESKKAAEYLTKLGFLFQKHFQDSEAAKRHYEKAIQQYSQLAEQAQTPQEASDHLVAAAKVAFEKLGDREKAIEFYVNAFEKDPTRTHLMNVLGDLYSQKEGWSDVVQHLGKEAEQSKDEKLRTRYLEEAADISTFVLSKPEEAIRIYEDILSKEPKNRKAFQALEGIYVRQMNWKKLIRLYESFLQSVRKDPAASVSLFLKMGLIYRDKLKRPLEAMDVYQRALKIQPQNFRIRSKVEELRQNRALWEKAVQYFESVLQETTDEKKRAHVALKLAQIEDRYLDQGEKAEKRLDLALSLDQETPALLHFAIEFWSRRQSWSNVAKALHHASNNLEKKEQRVQSLRSLSRLCIEKLQDLPTATDALSKLLELDPSDLNTREQLISLYSDQEKWQELEALLRNSIKHEQVSNLTDSKLQLALLLDENLKRPQEAVEIYKEILADEPTHMRSIGAIRELLTETRQWSDLAETLKNAGDHSRLPEDKIHFYVEAGTILEQKRGDLEEASKVLQKAVDQGCDEDQVLLRLEQLYRFSSNWSALTKLLDQELEEAASDEKRSELEFKLAELYEHHQKDPKKALSMYQRLYERDPGNSDVRKRLQVLSASTDRWEDLIGLLRDELSLVEDSSQKVSLLSRIGQLSKEKKNDLSAFEASLEEILSLEPSHEGALQQLAQHYREHGRSEKLLDVLQRRLGEVQDPMQRSQILREVAHLTSQVSNDPLRGLPYLEEALKLTPENEELRTQLASFYRRQERWRELIHTLEMEAERAVDPTKEAKVLFDMGVLYVEKLNQLNEARGCFERVVSLQPDRRENLRKLSYVQERLKDFDAAIQTGKRLFKGLDDIEEKSDTALHIGEFYAERKRDYVSAVEWYHKAYQIHPASKQARQHLISLLEQLEKWDELVAVLEEDITSLEPEERAKLRVKLARIYQGQLQNPELALMNYQLATELDPKNPDHYWGLRELLESEGNWTEYLSVSQELSQLLGETREKGLLLQEIGRIWNEKFQQRQKAIENLEASLKYISDDFETLALFSALLFEEKHLDRCLEITRSAQRLASDQEKKLPLLEREASILLNQDQLQEARTRFNAIIDIKPEHLHALRTLNHINRKLENWKDLLSGIQKEVHLAEDLDRKVELLFESAEIWEKEMNSSQNAREAVLAILSLSPTNEEAIRAYGQRATSRTDWNNLSGKLFRDIQGVEDKDAYARSVNAMASVWKDRFKDHPKAIEMLGEALTKLGDRQDLLESLADIYRKTEDSLSLADCLSRMAQLYENPEEKSSALFEVGKLWFEELNQPRQAIRCLEEAHELNGENDEISQLLLQVYLRKSQWQKADELLTQVLEIIPQHSQRYLELSVEKSQILADHLEKKDEATQVLENIVEDHPKFEDALDLLVRYKRDAEAWDAVAPLQEKLAALSEGAASTALLEESAKIYQSKLENPTKATEIYQILHQREPRNKNYLENLEELHLGQGDYLAALRVLERLDVLTEDDKKSGNINQRMGNIWLEKLDNREKAIPHFEKALSKKGVSSENLNILIDHYRKNRNFLELAEALEQKSSVVKGNEKLDILLEIASLWKDKLSNPVKAMEAVDKATKEDAKNVKALELLSKLYEDTQNFRGHADILEKQIQLEEDIDKKVELLDTLSLLQEKRLHELDKAAETGIRILELKPTHEDTLNRLRALYSDQGRWEEWREVLRKVLKKLEKKNIRIKLYKEKADIEENRLQRPILAISSLEEVMKLSPADHDVRDRLRKLYIALGKHSQLIELLTQQWETEEDREQRVALAIEIASIYESNLRNLSKASHFLNQALDLFPDDKRLVRQLFLLYRKLGDLNKAASFGAQLAGLLDIGSERSEILDFLIHHYEQLKDTPKVLEFLDMLAEDPGDRARALSRAIDRCEVEEIWDRGRDYVSAYIDIAPDDDQKIKTMLHLAWIEEEKLGKTNAAEKTLRRALKESSRQIDVGLRLKEFLIRADRFQDAAELLESLLETNPKRSEETLLYRELGRLYLHHLDRREEATEVFDKLLKNVPHDIPTLWTLSDLYFEAKDFHAALPILERLAKVSGSKAQPKESALLHHRLGQIHLHERHLDSALLHYSQALTYDSNQTETIEGLATTYFELGQWENAREMLLRLLDTDSLKDKELLKKQYYRLIQTLDHLKKYEESVETFEKAPSAVRKHLGILKLISFHFEHCERWKEAIKMHKKILDQNPSETVRLDSLFKIAHLSLEKLEKADDAKKALDEIFSIDPSHQDALRTSLRIYEQNEEWPSAIQVLERLIESEVSTSELVELHLRLCDIHDERTGDLNQAKEHFLQTLGMAADPCELLDRYHHLLENKEDWQSVHDILHSRLKDGEGEPVSSTTATAIKARLAEISLQKLDQAEEGKAFLEELESKGTQNFETKLKMASLYTDRNPKKAESLFLELLQTQPAKEELLQTASEFFDTQDASTVSEIVSITKKILFTDAKPEGVKILDLATAKTLEDAMNQAFPEDLTKAAKVLGSVERLMVKAITDRSISEAHIGSTETVPEKTLNTIEAWARPLGLSPRDIRVIYSAQVSLPTLDSIEAPCILVGPGLYKQSDEVQNFLVLQELLKISVGLRPFVILDGKSRGMFKSAFVDFIHGKRGDANNPFLETFEKNLGRREKKKLKEAASRLFKDTTQLEKAVTRIEGSILILSIFLTGKLGVAMYCSKNFGLQSPETFLRDVWKAVSKS